MAAIDALIEEAPPAPDSDPVQEPVTAIDFCPRCALILVSPVSLRKHRALCSGTC
jgi:hypothetical protein